MSQNKRSTPSSSSSKFAYEPTGTAGKKRSSPLLPIVGLVCFIVLAVGGWLASPEIWRVVGGAIPGLRSSDIPVMTGQIIATVGVVLAGMIVFGLVAAILAPKRNPLTNEANLAREKEDMKNRARDARAAKRSRGR